MFNFDIDSFVFLDWDIILGIFFKEKGKLGGGGGWGEKTLFPPNLKGFFHKMERPWERKSVDFRWFPEPEKKNNSITRVYDN